MKVYCVLINQVIDSRELRNDVRVFATSKSAEEYARAFLADETREVENDGWEIDDDFEKSGVWSAYESGDWPNNHSDLTLTEEDVIEEEENNDDKSQIISYIVDRVNHAHGNLFLDECGTVLDTADDEHPDNLDVSELHVMNGKLYAYTNWGDINLEDTITDMDDWYTLQDIVADLTDD